jgi:hypothetical protein
VKTLLRTIPGFIIDNHGKEWVVGLVVGGKVHQYVFGNKMFRQAGVRCENQPFELQEFGENGQKTLKIVPLAKANEAVLTKLDLGPEREAMLASILKYFECSGRRKTGSSG